MRLNYSHELRNSDGSTIVIRHLFHPIRLKFVSANHPPIRIYTNTYVYAWDILIFTWMNSSNWIYVIFELFCVANSPSHHDDGDEAATAPSMAPDSRDWNIQCSNIVSHTTLLWFRRNPWYFSFISYTYYTFIRRRNGWNAIFIFVHLI